MSKSAFGLRGGTALVAALISGALLVSLSATVSDAGAATSPAATNLSRCSIAKVWHALGPTYVESISVHGVSCTRAESLVKAYNACRVRSGGVKGYCRTPVDGFRFSELPRTKSPVQFIAKVTATKGSQTVVFVYSEDT